MVTTTTGAIQLSGKSEAKGRNGYFHLDRVELLKVNAHASAGGYEVWVEFLAKNSGSVGPARLLLHRDDATALVAGLSRFLGGAHV